MRTPLFLFCFFILSFHTAHAQVITTIAGTGIAGFSGDGIPAVSSELNFPNGIDMDASGNLYIGDFHNRRIRKIDHSGFITTIAGTGTLSCCFPDGTAATAANIGNVVSLAADAFGNLFYLERNNWYIEKINTAGVMSRYAGHALSFGFSGDGGPATAALFGNAVYGIAVDAPGNLYVCDWSNSRVRKVDAAGIITTIAGNGIAGYSGDGGPATDARLRPRNVTTDAAGNIYFSDQDYHVVRKVNSAGIISTVAGTGTYGFSGDGGPATAAMLNFPQQIRTDSAGNLFICDQNNNRVRKVSVSGIITTIAGLGIFGFLGDGGAATACKVDEPIGLVVRQGCGERIYISDANNNRIREIVYNNSLPRFTYGHANYLQLCSGAGVVHLDSMLAVTDSDAGQQENWSVVRPATHGVVAATYSAVSGGASTRPAGLTYTPTAGYTGTDTFSIIVNDCGNAPDTSMFYVTVRPLPVAGTIEGVTEVCVGDTISLIGTVTGGTWAASNSHAGVIPTGTSSKVYGRNPGIDTIRYSVSDTCGTATVQQIITVKHCSNAGVQNTVIEPFFIHPNPTNESLTVEAAPGSYTSLSVTNQLGQILIQQSITGAQTIVPVGALAPGMYFIALQGRQGVVVKKFVKM